MTTKLSLLALFALGIFSTGILRAQVTLEDFSTFQSGNTLFYGDWAGNGDPFAGDPTPIASFTQGAGFYNFASGSNADSSYVERTFASPRDLTGYDLLAVSLRLLPDNTADAFTVTLFDTAFNAASATFLISDFAAGSFTTRTSVLTNLGFDLTQVSLFRISGNDPFASGTLSVAFDHLAAVSSLPPPTAVPEPSTWAFAGIGTLALLIARRTSGSRRFLGKANLCEQNKR
jgi:hypothetical protein